VQVVLDRRAARVELGGQVAERRDVGLEAGSDLVEEARGRLGDTSRRRVTINAESWSSRALTVPSTWLRLSITWPITWSRSAIAPVSEAVLASSDSTVPPSPCSTCTISIDSRLTCSGSSAAKSGWKPLNSVVRLSGGVVRPTGIVPPGARVPGAPAPWPSARKRWPMRFL